MAIDRNNLVPGNLPASVLPAILAALLAARPGPLSLCTVTLPQNCTLAQIPKDHAISDNIGKEPFEAVQPGELPIAPA